MVIEEIKRLHNLKEYDNIELEETDKKYIMNLKIKQNREIIII